MWHTVTENAIHHVEEVSNLVERLGKMQLLLGGYLPAVGQLVRFNASVLLQRLEVRGLWHLLLWHIVMKCNTTAAGCLSDLRRMKQAKATYNVAHM